MEYHQEHGTEASYRRINEENKVTKALLAAAIVGLLFTGNVQADECSDAEDQATMNQCAAKDFQDADTELNGLYHQARQRIGDDMNARNLLRDAERSWVAFRDAECAFAASGVEGGSIYPMIYDACLADLTQARVSQLTDYLSAEEGDMGPLPPAD